MRSVIDWNRIRSDWRWRFISVFRCSESALVVLHAGTVSRKQRVSMSRRVLLISHHPSQLQPSTEGWIELRARQNEGVRNHAHLQTMRHEQRSRVPPMLPRRRNGTWATECGTKLSEQQVQQQMRRDEGRRWSMRNEREAGNGEWGMVVEEIRLKTTWWKIGKPSQLHRNHILVWDSYRPPAGPI